MPHGDFLIETNDETKSFEDIILSFPLHFENDMLKVVTVVLNPLKWCKCQVFVYVASILLSILGIASIILFLSSSRVLGR